MEPGIYELLCAAIDSYRKRHDRAPTLIVLSRQMRRSLTVADGSYAVRPLGEPETFMGIRVVEATLEAGDYWAVVGD